MKSFFTTLLLIVAFQAPKAHAAITEDYDCKDASNVQVYFEAQFTGEEGQDALYHGHVTVSKKGVLEVDFVPDHYVVNGGSGILGAWKNDGQYIIVNGGAKSSADDVTKTSGTMEFRIKTKSGKWISRKPGTAIKCEVGTEA